MKKRVLVLIYVVAFVVAGYGLYRIIYHIRFQQELAIKITLLNGNLIKLNDNYIKEAELLPQLESKVEYLVSHGVEKEHIRVRLEVEPQVQMKVLAPVKQALRNVGIKKLDFYRINPDTAK